MMEGVLPTSRVITGLPDETSLTFFITAHYANGGISNPLSTITVQTGVNHDGDALADSLDSDDDNDDVPDEDETIGCGLSADCDDDNLRDDADVDDDGDGLIELWSATMFDNVRYVLNGSGYGVSSTESDIRSDGCGGQGGINECNGYELTANISLSDYASGLGWDPIGELRGSFIDELGETILNTSGSFNAIFDGNGHWIRDLRINRISRKGVGLFGSVTGDATIRNLNVHGGECEREE